MKSSMANSIRGAIADYPAKEWKHWVLSWPGQAVLVAAEYQWTVGIEHVLREGAGDMGLATLAADGNSGSNFSTTLIMEEIMVETDCLMESMSKSNTFLCSYS